MGIFGKFVKLLEGDAPKSIADLPGRRMTPSDAQTFKEQVFDVTPSSAQGMVSAIRNTQTKPVLSEEQAKKIDARFDGRLSKRKIDLTPEQKKDIDKSFEKFYRKPEQQGPAL